MGKSIRIFLVDGTPSGIRTAEVVNWTGSILVAPRSRLAEIGNREDVKRTGIYMLVGDASDSVSKKRVYIGEADSVLERLKSHARNEKKEFWSDTILVTSKDLNLTKAHVRFLESHLIRIAEQSGKALVENDNQGTSLESITLPESDISDMVEFLEQVRLVLPVVGFDFLEESLTTQLGEKLVSSPDAPTFELVQGKFHAKARELEGKFVVLKGSVARRRAQPSWTLFKHGRELLVQEGKLIPSDDEESLLFADDVAFNSPSAASATVLARNDNGRQSWKIEDSGISYQSWFLSQIDNTDS